jgi:glucose dehydrogenase
MLFSATFMMLYFSGSPWIFPPLFVVALAWAVWDWGKDIYLSFRTAKAPIALK